MRPQIGIGFGIAMGMAGAGQECVLYILLEITLITFALYTHPTPHRRTHTLIIWNKMAKISARHSIHRSEWLTWKQQKYEQPAANGPAAARIKENKVAKSHHHLLARKIRSENPLRKSAPKIRSEKTAPRIRSPVSVFVGKLNNFHAH